MEIKVLGTGCAGCRALYETVCKVVAETGLDATVVKEEEITDHEMHSEYCMIPAETARSSTKPSKTGDGSSVWVPRPAVPLRVGLPKMVRCRKPQGGPISLSTGYRFKVLDASSPISISRNPP